MTRGRDWHRWQRNRAIEKKKGTLRRIGGDENVMAWTAGGRKMGRLSKGKIHCSWVARLKSLI